MFESLLSNFLSSRLTQFVKHIDTEKLKVGIWRGEVILEDLELRSDCLEGLGAPMHLQGGFVGKLRVKIPWNSLTSKPVVIELEKIHLILQPQEPSARTCEDNYAALSKQASIAAAELAKRANIQATTSWRSSILSRILTRVISSIQLRVLDVHIRVEVGSGLTGSNPFAIGAILHEISSSTGSFPEKLFHVKGLAIYWDRDIQPTSSSDMSIVQLTAKFAEWAIISDQSSETSSVQEDDDGDIFFVARSEDESLSHQFLLHPLDFTFALRILTTNLPECVDCEKPKYEADVRLKAVRVSLEVGQLWDMLRLADWIQVCDLRRIHSNLRPLSKVIDDPGAWWRYAITAVMKQWRSSRWSWSEIKSLCTNRREYSRLYRLMLAGKASSAERLQLASLEVQLPVEQIMFSRSIAEELLGKGQSSNNRERGWFRWGLRSVMSPQAGSKGGDGDLEVEFTREEEDFLSNALEITPSEEVPSTSDQISTSTDGMTDATSVPDDHRQALSITDTSQGGITRSHRKKSRRVQNKFQGVSDERAYQLAREWFDSPRTLNSSLALAEVSVEDLTITLAVRLPDHENEDLTCNFYNMQEVITASLSNISARISAGTEETTILSSIREVSVRDMLSQRSYFPCLISSRFTEVLEKNQNNSETERDKSSGSQMCPAVTCRVHIKGSTTSISVELQPLEIVVLPECLFALGAFFIPEYEAPFHEHRVIEALNSIDDGPGRIEAKLSFLVQQMSQEVIVDVRAEKPRLIIPGDIFRPDLTVIVCLDSLSLRTTPYNLQGATSWAISAAAKSVANCLDCQERQKQMQRMFFGSLFLNLSGIRMFLAESAPVANFSFMTYRLAHALKARMDSNGISLSNPQFSKISAEILRPIDVNVPIFLSLLRSDASMPLVYIGAVISSLQFELDIGEIGQILAIFEKLGQVSPQSLEMRQKIQDQARRANMGLPSTALSASTRVQGVPRSDDAVHVADPGESPLARIASADEKETEELPVVANQSLKDGDQGTNSAIDALSVRPVGDVASDVQPLQSPPVEENKTSVERSKAASLPDQKTAARWRIMQWLNGSRNIDAASPRPSESSSASVGRSEIADVHGHENLLAEEGTDVKEERNLKMGYVASEKVAGSQGAARSWFSWGGESHTAASSGSTSTAHGKQTASPSLIISLSNLAVNEQHSASAKENKDIDIPDRCDIVSQSAAKQSSGWFAWRRSPVNATPQTLFVNNEEQLTSLDGQKKKVNSLLGRLKFLYPVAEVSDMAQDGEALARRKVMELTLSTRLAAYRAVESSGRRWHQLEWKERLRACVEVDADSGCPNGQREFEVNDQGGAAPGLPLLRERHASSFIATDLDEMSRSDAIHVEATVSIESCSFFLYERRSYYSSQDMSVEDDGDCIGINLRFLPTHPGLLQDGGRDTSLYALVILQRHGFRLHSSVGECAAFCGRKDSICTSKFDSCIMSSRDVDILRIVGAQGNAQSTSNENAQSTSNDQIASHRGPLVHVDLCWFEDGYCPPDGTMLKVSCQLSAVVAKLGAPACEYLHRIALQFPSDQRASCETSPGGEIRAFEGVDFDEIPPAKISVQLGLLGLAVGDPINVQHWNKLTVGQLRCDFDIGRDSEKLCDISLHRVGLHSSVNDMVSWSTVLAPGCLSVGHGPAFAAYLLRKFDDRAAVANYRSSCLAFELQQRIRRAPNLIQDQKLNLRSQLQELKIDFRTQKRCAVGSVLVTFLVESGDVHDREEGMRLGQLLIDQGLMRKVPEIGIFEDSNSLYRFYVDEMDQVMPSHAVSDKGRDIQTASLQKKRFFVTARMMSLEINACNSFFDSVVNSLTALSELDPQDKSGHSDSPIDFGSDARKNIQRFLDVLDLDVCFHGFTATFPAMAGGSELLGTLGEVQISSRFGPLPMEESSVDNVGAVDAVASRGALGAAGQGISVPGWTRTVGTTGMDSLAWSWNLAHCFHLKLCGWGLTDSRARERIVYCNGLEMVLGIRPTSIFTLDSVISPIHFNLTDDCLKSLAAVGDAKWIVRTPTKSSQENIELTKTRASPALKSWFSGGYGFKFDFGGLTIALPANEISGKSFSLGIRPASCFGQILFRDCAVLPQDIVKHRTGFRPREPPDLEGSAFAVLLDRLGVLDLGFAMDDVVLKADTHFMFQGRSELSDMPSLFKAESPDEASRSGDGRGCGDDWRLIQMTACWRPGMAGGDVSLDCRFGDFYVCHCNDDVSALIGQISWLTKKNSSTSSRILSQKSKSFSTRSSSSRATESPTNKPQTGLARKYSSEATMVIRSSNRAAASGSRSAQSRGLSAHSRSAEDWDAWAEMLPGRLDVRVTSGELLVMSGPQQLCGTAAQRLCLAAHFAGQGLAELSGEGGGQLRSISGGLRAGLVLAWCDAAPTVPVHVAVASTVPASPPAHKLLQLPSAALRFRLAGPSAGRGWLGLLGHGAGMKATAECEAASAAVARLSFADLEAMESLARDALSSASCALSTSWPLDSAAAQVDHATLAQRAGMLSTGAVETKQAPVSLSSGASLRERAQSVRHDGSGCNQSAPLLAAMVSSLSMRAAGFRLIVAECRRGGQGAVLQRLPLLDLALSGVWAKMDATEGRGVTFSGGSFASCDYLNRGLGQWEPLLERWGCGLWVRTDAALGDLVGGVPGRLEAEVGSRERLNVNVSCAMFDVVMGVLAKDAKRWLGARVAAQAAADESVSGPVTAGGKDARDGEAFHPLWIKNETGQALVLESVPGPVVTAGAPRVAQHVNAGATQPVTCVPLVTAPSTGAGPGLPQVSLRQLRVFLAAAAVPGRPGWSSTGEKGEPDGPDGPESLAVMEGCIGEGRQTLQGLVDLDAGGPQARFPESFVFIAAAKLRKGAAKLRKVDTSLRSRAVK